MNTPVDRNPLTLQKDIEECKALAHQAAGYLAEGATGALAGAVGGAGEGAIVGAMITGGASPATAVGAPLGAVLGLFWSGYEADKTFKRSYSRCLAQRGHEVIN